jgi:hypothetical protein
MDRHGGHDVDPAEIVAVGDHVRPWSSGRRTRKAG